jgi:hypothetical protein
VTARLHRLFFTKKRRIRMDLVTLDRRNSPACNNAICSIVFDGKAPSSIATALAGKDSALLPKSSIISGPEFRYG